MKIDIVEYLLFDLLVKNLIQETAWEDSSGPFKF